MTRLSVVLSAVILCLLAAPSPARGQTWVGPGSDWNATGNWSPATVPNSPTAVVNFTGNAVGTVNISASVQVQSISFTNPTGSYAITSNNTNSLTVSAISVGAGVTATQTINLANTPGGSLLIPGGSPFNPLVIDNNSPFAGNALVIGPNTVVGLVGSNLPPVTFFRGIGNTLFAGSFATAGGHNDNLGFQKQDAGTLTFAGDGSALLGTIDMVGGTLILDYSTNTATKLGSGSLDLFNGTLALRPNLGTPVTQSFSGTRVENAHIDVQAINSGTVTLGLGAVTHVTGGTADFNPVSGGLLTFTVTTSTGNTNGLLGAGPAFATVGGGVTWATASGGAVVGLTTYGTNVYSAGTNTDVTAPATVAGITTNSLRFNTGNQTLTLSGTATLQSGGILVTPAAAGGTITGGSLTAPASGELLVHQYSPTPFTISSAVVSTAGLTKTGPGTLVLAAANPGLTGQIDVSRGNLTVTTLAAINSTNFLYFRDSRSGSALQTFTVDLGNNTNGTITPPVRVSAFAPAGSYGTILSTGASTGSRVTFTQLGDDVQQPTPIRFTGDPSNTSGFNLTSGLGLLGGVSLLHGFLGLGGVGLNANTPLVLEVGDPNNGGLEFLNANLTVSAPVTLGATTRVLANASNNDTISGPISGIGGLVKAGTGTVTLSNAGNSFTGATTVSAGTLSLGSTGGLATGANVTVAAGATFTAATTATSLHLGTLTLNGGTFRATGTAQSIGVNQISTGVAGGTVNFTGAGTDSLSFDGPSPGITINGDSTWLSPANATTITNAAFAELLITIAPGVTLTNGIALKSAPGTFRITGGGTLFQNSDATNAANMTASVTVSQGRFRVVDVTSGGGLGNLGPVGRDLVLDGGTFAYGGPTAATGKAIDATLNHGTVEIESAATTLTLTGAVFGPGGLTKSGPGTLAFATIFNNLSGITVNAGTVQAASDATLGSGPIVVNGGGTLNYTASTSTSRTITLNFGTLTASAGATLSLNGAAVNGGFVRGPGSYIVNGGAVLNGVTTSSSTALVVNGPASFVNFTSGGSVSVAVGPATPVAFSLFTNQGSGAVTLGAGSRVNAADFQSYGSLVLTPGTQAVPTQLTNTGTSSLFLNGGSRTFLATPATADQMAAGIDLHGQNAVVAGGLFVNNGYVVDSTPGGPGRVVADFGALVKGAGFFQGPVVTQNGGRFQAGNSPGAATFGRFTFGPGGVADYVFTINDATGDAGPSPAANGQVSGWGLIRAVARQVGPTTTTGDFAWTADSGHKLSISLQTLVNPTAIGTDVPGPMAHFNEARSYEWPVVTWAGTYAGPADVAALTASSAFDTSGFLNPINGTFGWTLDPPGHTLSVTYTPVPEPGTLALAALATAGLAWRQVRFCRSATRNTTPALVALRSAAHQVSWMPR